MQTTPDDRSGDVYLYDPELQLAAETAIVSQRPLLLRGEPGSGKSSFAAFAARNLNWCYYETTVTGRTEARDLLWKFDALRRLRDAQASTSESPLDMAAHKYITPGALWWAFDHESAVKVVSLNDGQHAIAQPSARTRFQDDNHGRDQQRFVVLIDEIDKADPDVPNDLLEVFGLNRFTVDELGNTVLRQVPDADPHEKSPNHFGSGLIVITTNQERDLPNAFVRRCVVHTLRDPEEEAAQVDRLLAIAELHLSDLANREEDMRFIQRIAAKCCNLRRHARQGSRRGPSIAEFLDAVTVCHKLGITADSETWRQVESCVLIKEA